MKIELFSAKRAAILCGFRTVAMLDYLERSDIMLRPRSTQKVRGKRRMYDFRELIVLRAIATLLSKGASVLALKKALLEFQREKWSADQASLGYGDNVFRFLIMSKSGIVFAKSADSLFNLSQNGQMEFAFIMDIDKIHSDLCFEIQQNSFNL